MELLTEIRGQVALITINRPEKRNALNTAVREGIRQAVTDFDRDESVRVIILTGAGSVFSAGADLKEMAETGLQVPPPDFIPDLSSSKPVIAAVNGSAFGGGFFLVQQADIVICSPAAEFGITEARHGRGAPWALPLPLLIPPRIAMEMIATAEPISAQRALEAGLVNLIDVDPLSAALTMAQRISDNAPLSVRAGKAMVRRVVEELVANQREEVQKLWEPVYLSDDAQEGPRAFAEKRAPHWQGR